MEVCKLTSKELDYYNTVTTTEGHKIHIEVYKMTTERVKKGLVTIKECKKTLALQEECRKATDKLKLLLRKKAIRENNEKRLGEILSKQLKAENNYSIKQFKKVRDCLNIEEYLELMNHFINEYTPYSSERVSTDMRSYTWGEQYLKKWSNHYPTTVVKRVLFT